MNSLLLVLIMIWGIPQNLFGLIMIVIYHTFGQVKGIDFDEKHGVWYVNLYDHFLCSFTLGQIVFLDEWANEVDTKHEYGHTIQSIIFGPLYLLIVGIPSLINNIKSRIDKKFISKYYNTWPENNADYFGNVKRIKG